ncbi:hypothetical protein A2U01_0070916, partial [Trifolium medium]|nr:hypothetical protein [Trifolium medium]
PNVDDPRLLSPMPMVRRRVRPALCFESLPDKSGQTADPVEHINSGTSV